MTEDHMQGRFLALELAMTALIVQVTLGAEDKEAVFSNYLTNLDTFAARARNAGQTPIAIEIMEKSLALIERNASTVLQIARTRQ